MDAMPPAPGMPPAEPMGPPPAAMPPGGPPPGGGAPTPEQVAATEQQAQAEAIGNIAAMAPMPESPYKVKTIQMVVDELNKLLEKALEVTLPEGDRLKWEPPDGTGPQWDQPLPPQVFLPIVALSESAKSDPKFSKHVIEVDKITNDGALSKVSGQIRRMSGDKKFLETLRPPAPPPEMGMEGPGPEEMGPVPPMPGE